MNWNFFAENSYEIGSIFKWWVILIIAAVLFIIILVFPWSLWKRKSKAKKKETPKLLISNSNLVKVKAKTKSCQKCQVFENEILDMTGASSTHKSWKDALKQGFKHDGCTHELEAWSE